MFNIVYFAMFTAVTKATQFKIGYLADPRFEMQNSFVQNLFNKLQREQLGASLDFEAKSFTNLTDL